jgi:hypothetical protein
MTAEALPWARIGHLTKRRAGASASEVHAIDQVAAHYAHRFAAMGAPLTDEQNVFAALVSLEVVKVMFVHVHHGGYASHEAMAAILEWLAKLQIVVAEHAPAEVRS